MEGFRKINSADAWRRWHAIPTRSGRMQANSVPARSLGPSTSIARFFHQLCRASRMLPRHSSPLHR